MIALGNGLVPDGKTLANCQDIGMISVPIRWHGGTMEELELMWFTPYCRYCEIEGRMCGLKGSSNGETTCFGYNGGESQTTPKLYKKSASLTKTKL